MRSEMTGSAVIELVELLDGAAIEVWLDGGWAVDALFGEQTRTHKDLDIILRAEDLSVLRTLLLARGFEMQPGGVHSSFVLADDSGLVVDVHAITFDRTGNGVYQLAKGQEWVFPAAGFAGRGIINGVDVRCLSAEVQVLCHAQGYDPTDRDFRDMELLAARFGVELPPNLKRSTENAP